jgi:hypothetical protein
MGVGEDNLKMGKFENVEMKSALHNPEERNCNKTCV